MDTRHRHNMNHAYAATDTQDEARAAYQDQKGVQVDRLQLRETGFLKYVPEFADGMNLAAPVIFPNLLLIQINNTLATRQIRPKGLDAFEIYQTVFGYADDSPEMTEHRLLQTNLIGPAGYVSMEDGEAIEIVAPLDRVRARRDHGDRDGRPRPDRRHDPPAYRGADPRLLVLLVGADGRRAAWSGAVSVPREAVHDRARRVRPAHRRGPARGMGRAVRRGLRLPHRRARERRAGSAPDPDLGQGEEHAARPDRVLRHVNEYNLHWDRHVIGPPRIRAGANGEPGRSRRRTACSRPISRA